ncbi:MAG: SGNH/GDSL hydrolase family protein [Methyloligellaceae bacterium]
MVSRIKNIQIVTFLLVLGLGSSGALAQALSDLSRTYVTAFPDNDQYQLTVFGDSLAEGVASGLGVAFDTDRRVNVRKEISYGASMYRSRRFNWAANLQNNFKKQTNDIAVIMMGLNDRTGLRRGRERIRFGSDSWKSIYGQRVDRLMKTIKKSKVAIYWVGLPIMRRAKDNMRAQTLNEVFREKAFLNGIKFVDTWNGFADQYGRFNAFGPDLTGKVRRIRADDGIHFTLRGNRKLAHFVEREIRRDLAIARSERNIPLAGDEKEQERLLRQAVALSNAKKVENSRRNAKKKTNFFGFGKSDQKKKDKGDKNITTINGIDIVRPTLSSTVLSNINQRRGLNFAQNNAIIANDIDRELTALATISQNSNIGLKNAKQRVPITQSPYYKVLVKGDALQAKKGRADDFSWDEAGAREKDPKLVKSQLDNKAEKSGVSN